MIRQRSFGFFEAAGVSVLRAWDMSVMQARMLLRMVTGQMSLRKFSGPLAIAEYAGQSASTGVAEFLGFLVVISLSLGFLNLLPIPILDGGQIAVSARRMDQRFAALRRRAGGGRRSDCYCCCC
jgi:regulator of sigma E protease